MHYKVGRRFYIDAAHFLPRYNGKCKNMHGHRWSIDLIVDAVGLNDQHMVVDFVELKQIFNMRVGYLDHSLLNTHLDNPTAENLSRFIFNKIRDYMPEETRLFEVVVYESPDSWARYGYDV